VSVLVPVLDGAATLPELLAALRAQQAPWPFEIVAVDSGSRDESVALLERGGDRLLRIPRADFGHGRSRNLGIAACRGELVALLVQDALPADSDWLARLVSPFETDPRLAGTFAQQLPRPGASRLTRHHLSGWVAAGSLPRSSEIADPKSFEALSPVEKLLLCAFDDVSSCIRRSVWERIPFPDVPIAEDLAWAREVLLAGHRIDFVPEARVFHSHERGFAHELARTRATHRELARLFALRTIPDRRSLLLSMASTLSLHRRLLRDEAKEGGLRALLGAAPRALSLAVALPLGQYLGGRDAAPGRTPGDPR
jgi:rhamnosyltransferase